MLSCAGFLAAALVLAGCAKPPTEEINAAQALIDSVKALTDVQTYAMDSVQAAEQALAAVRQQVTEKKYKEARAALPAISATAFASVEVAASAKEAARLEAESAISDANVAIAEAEGKIPRAPRHGKGAIRDIKTLKAQVDSAKVGVQDAQASVGTQDYRGAAAKAREAATRARDVTRIVDDAIAMREQARRR
jgi:hypothetical protein